MKRLITTFSATAALALSLVAADYIPTVQIKSEMAKLNASSAELAGLKYSTIYLYPQTTIKGNDAEANKKFDGAKAIKADVAVVANQREFSVVVKWADNTNSKQRLKSVKAFGDGVAVQFAQNCSEDAKLPYIGMGSDGRPVTILLQKNTEGVYAPTTADISNQQAKNNLNLFGDDLKKKQEAAAAMMKPQYQKVFVAEGFRSTTEVKDNLNYKMDMKYANGKWTAVFTKPIKDDYSSIGSDTKTQDDGISGSTSKTSHAVDCDTQPMAIAIWDGAKDGRNGIKWLSSWTPIKFKESEKAKKAIAMMAEKAKGNVANGKKLASDNCYACHTMGDNKAQEGMAPNLNNIGGYANAAYIRESLVSPSAVVVPGQNVNQRPSMQYYSVDAGKRTSNMPAFDFLKPNEIEDLVAYLQTLKAGGAK